MQSVELHGLVTWNQIMCHPKVCRCNGIGESLLSGFSARKIQAQAGSQWQYHPWGYVDLAKPHQRQGKLGQGSPYLQKCYSRKLVRNSRCSSRSLNMFVEEK